MLPKANPDSEGSDTVKLHQQQRIEQDGGSSPRHIDSTAVRDVRSHRLRAIPRKRLLPASQTVTGKNHKPPCLEEHLFGKREMAIKENYE